MNGIPGDDDFGDDRTGNGDPDDPDNPDNEGPDDLIKNPDNPDHGDENPDDSEHGIQNNLADTIAALARNVQHQGGDHSVKYTDLVHDNEVDKHPMVLGQWTFGRLY